MPTPLLFCSARQAGALLALSALVAATPTAAYAQEGPTLGVSSAGRPLAGGVPTGTLSREPVTLSLQTVVRRALAQNLGVLSAARDVGDAGGKRAVALSELLPTIEGAVSETRRKTNLEAFGFPLQPGFPRVVGPFNVFDARVSVRQSLFDYSALRSATAENHLVTAARQTARSAREQVILVAAYLYLDTIAAQARVAAARAQLETSRAIHQQAVDLKGAGIVAGIDVVRAEVRVGADQQAATAERNVLEKTKLQLARLIGLPIGQAFTLGDSLPTIALPSASFDDVLTRANATRPELLAAQARVQAAEARVQAVRGERLPTASVFGDYGVIGLAVDKSLPTFAITGAVRVPLFDSGRISGRLAQAQADLALRRAELDDIKAGVYYATKGAFLDLESAQERLDVATRARSLADLQLTQTRDRFAAGVTNNIEVIQAQEAVADATEHHIAALHDLNVARALVLGSPGSLEDALDTYFGTDATQGSSPR